MRRIGLVACVLLAAGLGACSGGPRQTGQLYLPPGGVERIYLFGEFPTLSVSNGSEDAVSVEIQANGATTGRESVPAGGSASWDANGPWTFLFSNPSQRGVKLSYEVRGGEAVE